MKVCKDCGSELLDGAKYCDQCGSDVSEIAQTDKPTTLPKPPAKETLVTPPVTPPAAPKAPEKKGLSKNTVLIAVCGGAVLLLIIIVVGILISSKYPDSFNFGSKVIEGVDIKDLSLEKKKGEEDIYILRGRAKAEEEGELTIVLSLTTDLTTTERKQKIELEKGEEKHIDKEIDAPDKLKDCKVLNYDFEESRVAEVPPASTTETAPTEPTPTPQPEAKQFSGSGSKATQPFSLKGGLAIFHMQNSGGSNFAIELLDQATGEMSDLLVNVIGSFSGTKASSVIAGTYVLNITSSGSWTIAIDEPTPTSVPYTPQTYTGTGPTATGFFQTSGGLVTLTMSHQGSGNFAVLVYDSRGNMIDLAANEIGPYSGSQAVSVSSGTYYMLDVEADGPWSVEVN